MPIRFRFPLLAAANGSAGRGIRTHLEDAIAVLFFCQSARDRFQNERKMTIDGMTRLRIVFYRSRGRTLSAFPASIFSVGVSVEFGGYGQFDGGG